MSTKQQTTSSNQYNPFGMSAYNSMIPQASGALQSEISNPYNNMFFNNQMAMGMKQNQGLISSQNSSIQQNMQSMGMANSPIANFMMRRNAMQGSQMNSGTSNNLLLNAANLRQSAIGGAMSFNPLQTGQSQVQQKSGLGTWLPQVAGMGLGALGGMFGAPPSGPMSNMGGNFSGNSMSPSGSGSPFMQPGDPSMSFGNFGNPGYGPGNFSGMGGGSYMPYPGVGPGQNAPNPFLQ